MTTIQSLNYRTVLNSHAEFTHEFILKLSDGSVGLGASPKGETVSIYEDRKVAISPQTIAAALKRDGIMGQELTQAAFDAYLDEHIPEFGRNNAFSLSLAFFNALSATRSIFELFERKPVPLSAPCLCLNILNGGWHAYTNPVLSDFSEFMLVAKSNHIETVIGQHNEIQRRVKEELLKATKTVVSGNPVNRFATADNRECIDFLLKLRDGLGLANDYDLMIDASAGDLWSDNQYRLAITDQSARASEGFQDYWLDLIRQYQLRFLEDPFAEKDVESWRKLVANQQSCLIIGDNFYSSDAARIRKGAANRCTHGVIIKPNQAGTVTGIKQAVQATQETNQVGIASHRSISTEETFLSTLTCIYGLKYIKIGPLQTDYSSVVRLNAIARLLPL